MGKAQNPQNLTLTLFQHSDVRRGGLWGTGGAREVFGTFHVKHYMFDDSVILSGANLSEEYLTTRYDRYLYINDDKDFCDFLEDFDRICIDSGDKLAMSGTFREGWESVDKLKEGVFRQFSVFLYNAYAEKRLAESLTEKTKEDVRLDLYLEGKTELANVPHPTKLGGNNPDPRHEFSDHCTQQFKEMKAPEQLPLKVDAVLQFYRKKYEDLVARNTAGTSYLFPAFQLALINYRVEEQLILTVFRHLFAADPTQQYELTFTTGYFNPSDQLLELFRQIPPNVNLTILTAAPSCNSFFKARGVKGSVPALYRIALKNWLTTFAGRQNVQFLEFTKPGSTYHAKGLWLRSLSDPHAEYLTIYGSSNYSNRSFHRDLENQFYIVTRDPERIADFEEERMALLSHGRPITLEEVNSDATTPIGLFQRGLYRLFRNCL
jgi:CDP-diacylglycerol--glycerol-3-phosphate 3-phosphatidyltransferase